MTAKAKELDTVLRLARWEVDEKRRVLGELLKREDAIKDMQRRLTEELEVEQRTAGADLEAAFIYGAYAGHYIQRRDFLAQAMAELQAEVETAQMKLADTYKTLKTYETARANRLRREREEEARKEQTVLDEIAQTLHRRRQEGA